MYLSKSLLYAVALLSTASTVLSAPVEIASRGGELLSDVAEDLALRANVPTYTDVYTRVAYAALVDTVGSLVNRDQIAELQQTKSEYCKTNPGAKGCRLVKRSESDVYELASLVSRAGHHHFTPAQTQRLKKAWAVTHHPAPNARLISTLKRHTGLKKKQVKRWFENKRAKADKDPQNAPRPMMPKLPLGPPPPQKEPILPVRIRDEGMEE